ncbi:MAG: mechanosensitive ion channel family protein [Gemmatimonadota bacterium]|jgi:small-conductance mechanosensitive channel
MIPDLLANVPGWLVSTGLVTLAVLAALVGHAALIAAMRRTDLYRDLEETILHSTRRPGRLLLVLLAVLVVLPELTLPPGWDGTVRHLLQVILILTGAWLIVGASRVFEALVEERYRADVADNLRARRIQTKVRLLRRLVATVVVFLASAAILMTFDPVRRLGISLFASAGVAGLIVGIAAQPTLSNLVAGLQLALTEPIRLDDVVIVEGEWGWVEEISMTYVVVRVWDRRRLVVPLRWFIENPFQNWTRQTADILGSVHLHLDYRTPIEPLRTELRRVVEEEGTEWWDGEVCGLQVVDTTERTVEVRALVSAATSPDAWELRCLVRERLVGWMQEHHPESLPRIRAEVEALAAPEPDPGRTGAYGGGSPPSSG